MNLLYQRNVRGKFAFAGSASNSVALPVGATEYADDASQEISTSVRSLADFLAGYATSGGIARGQLQRDIWVNQWDVFAQDQYQLNDRLTLNYGVRWDYSGPVYSTDGTLSDFNPNSSTGYSIVGTDIDTLYPRRYTNFSPRFGFSYKANEKLVVRGTYGLFFDLPNLNGFFDNRPGNGASAGVQANNVGPLTCLLGLNIVAVCYRDWYRSASVVSRVWRYLWSLNCLAGFQERLCAELQPQHGISAWSQYRRTDRLCWVGQPALVQPDRRQSSCVERDRKHDSEFAPILFAVPQLRGHQPV
jgi:hypothetical protein